MHSHTGGSSGVGAATEEKTQLQIFLLTSGLIGLQFCWAVQIGYVTKSLLELGLAQRFVSYAWLAGPIAGLIVQPTVGVISDRCTSPYGRRRPFLVIGSILSVVLIILFSFAEQIGIMMGDPHPENSTVVITKPRALLVAILSFWALDFSINAAQGPIRALMADVLPPAQHRVGNAYFALATGLGNCSGSFLGSMQLARFMPFFPGDLQALYTIAAIVLLFTMGCTVFSTKEVPLRPPSESASHSPEYDSLEITEGDFDGNAISGSPNFFEAARIAPHPFWPAFIIQCFSWFGWFTLFVFGTSWVGAEVFNGSFTAAEGTESRRLYDAGVRLGNLGIGLQSVLTVVSAPLLPLLIRRTSAYTVYLAASISLAVALTSAFVITAKWQAWIATLMIASTGFAWAVTMTVPWSLMSESVAKFAPERAGIYATMFNLSQCFPEITVSLVAEEVERITKKQSAVLVLGGITVFIAAILIVVMRVGKPERLSPEDEEILTPLGSDLSSEEQLSPI